jgi:hypothetical protein
VSQQSLEGRHLRVNLYGYRIWWYRRVIAWHVPYIPQRHSSPHTRLAFKEAIRMYTPSAACAAVVLVLAHALRGLP